MLRPFELVTFSVVCVDTFPANHVIAVVRRLSEAMARFVISINQPARAFASPGVKIFLALVASRIVLVGKPTRDGSISVVHHILDNLSLRIQGVDMFARSAECRFRWSVVFVM